MQASKMSLETLDKAEVAESMKAHNSAIQLRSKCIIRRVESASSQSHSPVQSGTSPALLSSSSSSSSSSPPPNTIEPGNDEPIMTCFGDANADTDIYTAINPELLAFFKYLPEGLSFSKTEIDSLTRANRVALLSAGYPPMSVDAGAQGSDYDWAVLTDVLMQTPGGENSGATTRELLRPFLHIASPEELRRKRVSAMPPASAHPVRASSHAPVIVGTSRLHVGATATAAATRRSDGGNYTVAMETDAHPMFDSGVRIARSHGHGHHQQHQQGSLTLASTELMLGMEY